MSEVPKRKMTSNKARKIVAPVEKQAQYIKFHADADKKYKEWLIRRANQIVEGR